MNQDKIIIYTHGTTVEADASVIYNPFPGPPLWNEDDETPETETEQIEDVSSGDTDDSEEE